MENMDNLETLYQNRLKCIPENLQSDIGHFSVLPIEPYVGNFAKPLPYRRRDYYKISLLIGSNRVHYADKVMEVNRQALVFSSPNIPYSWEQTGTIHSGYFCVFSRGFFHQFGNIHEYSVFQPGGKPVFELTDEQRDKVAAIFVRLVEEMDSDYVHKYDVVRTQVMELLHFAMKMNPATTFAQEPGQASRRITTLFLELLERQFPLDDAHQRLNIRSASEYADQLAVHVNHLNRSVKEITQKTTTQIIADRMLQEGKILLKHSDWNISEIACALGFTEVTHFNNFFKKHTELSPGKFRTLA